MKRFIEKIEILKPFIPYEEGEVFELKGGINMLVGDQGCGKSTFLEVIRKISTDFIDYVKITESNEEMQEYIYFDTESHNPRYNATANMGSDSMCAFLKLIREDLANGFDHMMGEKCEDVSEEVVQRFPKMNLGGMKEKTRKAITESLQKGMAEYIGTLIEMHGKHDRLKYKEMSTPMDPGVYQFKSHGQSIIPFLENFNDVNDSLILLDEPETALSLRSQDKMVRILKDMEKRGCQIIVASHCERLMKSMELVYSMEHRKWINPYDFIETQK